MPTTRSQSLSAAAAGSASGSASPPSLPGAAAPYQENVGRDLSEVGASAPYRELDPSRSGATTPTASLDASLSRLDDAEVLHAKDAKLLRDATSAAITRVWKDARSQTTALVQKINEGNSSLSRKLNESSSAVGTRLDSLPSVAMLGLDSQTPKVVPFSGSTEEGMQFSVWLRRLDDIIRMRPSPLSSEHKANFLIGHLDGVAREKVEELNEDARKDFDLVANHLRSFFESPQQRYVARQKLSACRQEPAEPSSSFANRVLNLVRAATAGQDPVIQKERVLEEFVSRLRGDIRYFVKLDNPSTLEQAVTKAQMVEQLLSEATADRLIHPGRPEPVVNALDGRVRTSAAPPTTPTPHTRPSGPGLCYNCGDRNHLAYQCRAPINLRKKDRSAAYRRYYRGEGNARLMACGPSTSSLVSSEETALAAAQRQIANLTLTVDKTRAELDQSNSRIVALLKRNEELAQSAFERNDSPSTSASGSSVSRSALPDVRTLFLTCLVLPCLVGASASPDAWLCPSENPTNIFFVPSSYNCSWLLPNATKHLQSLSLHVYRPNTKRYSTPAFLCKIVRHSVSYSVSFFGARTEDHHETLLPVSAEQCKRMARHRKCEHGDLSQQGSIWRTSNELTFAFPSAPLGCCSDHTAVAHNCYLLETVVHARYGDESPESAAGDMRSCLYKDGMCILSDGSVVIWSPDQEEGCRFTSVAKMKGYLMGNVWISESKEFALSWSGQSPVVQDCLRELTITDQGYAVVVLRRVPRSLDAGLVTTNQLSAQLLAVEGSVQDAVAALFLHAVQALCERTNVLAIALHSALRTNPTLTMRTLIGRSDLAATHLGNGFVQVRRCLAVPPSAMNLQPFNGTCFAYPRVSIQLRSGSLWHAFLNPFTGVVVSRAPRVDCVDATPFVLSANSSLLQFSPLSGQLSPLPLHQIRSVASPFSLDALSLSPKLTIFHNLILTNFSELVADSQFQEMWTLRDQEKLVDHIAQVHHSANSIPTADQAKGNSLLSFLPFSLPSPFDIWVFVCCLVVSARIAKFILVTYIGLNYPGLLPLLKRMNSQAPAAASMPLIIPTPIVTEPERQAIPLQPMRPTDLGISKIDIDVQNAWPPRASTVPVQVLSFGPGHRFFVTQIPIRVNGMRLLALIDTGASITVASKSLLSLLGIFELDECVVPSAIGMAGIPVHFVGSATVTLTIGRERLKQKVHFTEGQCVPVQADSYDIILGNDVLRRLPPWSVDYDNRVFSMGSDRVEILTGAVCNPRRERRGETAVRVAETTVLRPGCETLVPCYVTGIPPDTTMWTTPTEPVDDTPLYVAPAVFHSSHARVLVTNPTTAPLIVYRNERIAGGALVVESDDGSLMEPPANF